ncbi:unnamed protein product, partial [marine sediment metagenome]
VVIGLNNQSVAVWTYNETFLLNASYVSQTDECIHVAYTFDSNGTIHHLYINGTERDNSTASPDTGVPGTLRLARNWTGPLPYISFDGIIDDVAIWNRTLSESEIQYFIGLPVSYCGVEHLCNDATLILWDETDKRNLPFATGIGGIVGQPIKSFTNYTLIYAD